MSVIVHALVDVYNKLTCVVLTLLLYPHTALRLEETFAMDLTLSRVPRPRLLSGSLREFVRGTAVLNASCMSKQTTL